MILLKHIKILLIVLVKKFKKQTNTQNTQKKNTLTQTQRKKWITFTYYSPLIRKVTNLLKSTDLNIAFKACYTI